MFDELAAGQVTLGTVWLLGVSMGLTACTVTCLPFLGTWALGRASRSSEALLHTSVFLAGRIITYTLLAALAGSLGLGVENALGGVLGTVVIGCASLLAGIWLLAQPRQFAPCGRKAGITNSIVLVRRTQPQRRDQLPPLLLGAALSLTPCTPLASLLALAAQAGTAVQGASFGLAFGLGAAMTPILILVPLAGRIGRELMSGRAWMGRWLNWISALVLILLGLRRLWLVFG